MRTLLGSAMKAFSSPSTGVRDTPRSRMDTLSFARVRCFGDEQHLDIRPVTLLVGENSSGKSTVLAMVRAAWDVAFAPKEPDFNEEPFDLGGYDALAYYHGGQGKRAHDFEIGATFLVPGPRGLPAGRHSVRGAFVDRAGQPVLAVWTAERGNLKLRAEYIREDVRISVTRGDKVLLDQHGAPPRGVALNTLVSLVILRRAVFGRVDVALGPAPLAPDLFQMVQAPPRMGPRPIAGAPIRTKPSRTYDPKREVPEPEGSHVPMELATLRGTNREEFEELAARIAAYGKDANLLSKLQVKRLGKKAGDPFQLVVAVDKFPFNLRDVGYGVSQILPILVDTLTAPKGQTFLLQQPEVHLHPRAQAALGSLFVEQAASRGQTFVVETHSDHLVDRVRMDIRDRRTSLKAKDVVILYFERSAGQAMVHRITLDEEGNLVGVPPGYRRFFLEEERRLLGI